jgi:hypothetical protein
VVLLLVGCAGRFPPGWLYVTRVATTSATVAWTGAAEVVRCRGAGGSSLEATAVPGRRGLRVARLAGLTPHTLYRCRLDGPADRRALRFRTAPADGAPFVFAAVGDTGDGSPEAARLARRVLAGRPDFLIHLGDFAYRRGKVAEFATRFFRPYRRLLRRVPIMPTPGNHDLVRGSVYRDLFASTADDERTDAPHYAFDWGAAHFASVAFPEFARDAKSTDSWLATDLAGVPAARWRVVFLHEPSYTAGGKATVAGLRETFEPVVEAAHVDLVLAGHQHFYERGRPTCAFTRDAAVLHVTSGGGGANLDPAAVHPNFARSISATHYLRVRVTADALEIRAIDLAGHVLDRVRRRRGDRVACVSGGWPAAREK